MRTENKVIAQKNFEEAVRYMRNAHKELLLANKNGKIYRDVKHLRVACGTAYLAALKAVEGIIIMRNMEKPKRRASIEFYQQALSQIDKKLLTSLNIVYPILHLYGYYDGFNEVKTIGVGFKEAENIIDKLATVIK